MSQLVSFIAILLLMLQFRLVRGQTTHTTTIQNGNDGMTSTTESSTTWSTTSWFWSTGTSTASTRLRGNIMDGILQNRKLPDEMDWTIITPPTTLSTLMPSSSTTPSSTTIDLSSPTKDKSFDWQADINSRMRGGIEEVIVDYDETTDPETEETETVSADANNPATSGNILAQMFFPDSGVKFLKPMFLHNILFAVIACCIVNLQ